MIRKIALSASVVALAAASFGLATAGSADAGLTVTAGPGSHIKCNFSSSVKLAPPLKDNWVKADHQPNSATPENNPDVNAIPNTTYAPAGPGSTSAKSATVNGTCSPNTVTDGTNTAHITKMALTLVTTTPGTTPLTCVDLVNSSGAGDARYKVTIKYTATAGDPKVAGTTITNATITSDPSLPGFDIGGGTITGSFAGGSSTAKAAIDNNTFGIFAAEALGQSANSSSPHAPNACQAGLKIKTGDKHSATLVKPKGLKSIGIDPSNSTVELVG